MAEASEEVTRFLEAIEAFEAIEDPEERTREVSKVLRNWKEHLSRLRKIREDSVRTLREDRRKTWPEIAEIIGEVTPERAQQISKGLSGAERKRREALKKTAEIENQKNA
jgi:DNA-directed RNA polymerase subunit F